MKIDLVFWLPTGYHLDGIGTDAADTNFENLMAQWVKDASGTPYSNILSQYYNPGTNSHISNVITLSNTRVDTSPFPRGAGTQTNPIQDADFQAEVSKVASANGWETGINDLIAVFTPWQIQWCIDSLHCSFDPKTPGSESDCGYHGHTSVFGADQPYAVMSSLRCVAVPAITPYMSPDAESTLSTFTHEAFEAATDPMGGSWATSSGDEIGDLCNSAFETPNDIGADVYLNGRPYLIQMEYSNAAKACVLDYSSSTADFTHAPNISGSGLLDNSSPAQGATLKYTFTVSNNSNTSSAQRVEISGGLTGTSITGISDALPSPSAPGDGFIPSYNGSSTFTVTYANLAVHQKRQFIVTATVNTAGQRATPCPTAAFEDWVNSPRPPVSMCGQSPKTLPVDGSVTPVTTTSPGRIADVQFAITGTTIIPYFSAQQTQGLIGCFASTGLTYSLSSADGTIIQNVAATCGTSTGNAGLLFNPMRFPAGTYQITITPAATVYGTYDIQMFPSGTGPTITANGGAATASTTSPGQAAVLTLAPTTVNTSNGSVGDLFSSYGLSLNTCSNALVDLYLFAPYGNQLSSNAVNCGSPSGKGSGVAFPPTIGNGGATILVVPASQVDGTYNISYYGTPDEHTGPEVPSTSALANVTVPTNGQSAFAWFTTPIAGGPLAITDTAAIPNCDKVNAPVTVVIWDPYNRYAAYDFAPCDGYASTTLFAGSSLQHGQWNLYNIQIIPSPGLSGNMTFQMTTGANMTTVPLDGTSTSTTIGQTGQSAVMKFTTTAANQAVSGTCSVISGYTGSQANYSIYDDSGNLRNKFLYGGCANGAMGSTMFSPPITFPTAGTYYIVINPNNNVLDPRVGGLSATWTFSLT